MKRAIILGILSLVVLFLGFEIMPAGEPLKRIVAAVLIIVSSEIQNESIRAYVNRRKDAKG